MQAIFDLDGTLLDTVRYAVITARRTAREFGWAEPTEERVRGAIGLPLPQYLTTVFPQADLDELTPRYRASENEDIQRHGVLFPGIPEMLDQLRAAGVTTAVCSNGELDYVVTVLDLTGLTDRIDRPTSARSHASKAAAVAALVALDQRSVMVGDTIMDVEAAAANAIPSVGCLYGYGDPADLARANRTAGSVTEVLTAVRLCLGLEAAESGWDLAR